VGVVVPAAGPGLPGEAALVHLAGRPLLAHTLQSIEANHCVTTVVVAADPDAIEGIAKLVADEGLVKVVAVVGAGPTRQASVVAGLRALPRGPGYVALHDAVRPLVAPGAVDHLLSLLVSAGAAGVVPGVPVTDTIRHVDAARRSTGLVDRDQLRAMQTPQLFVRQVLEDAHRRALRDGIEGTDEVGLVERAGHPVQVVPGDPENLAVTTPLDLAVAEALLMRRRGPS
jgi:2-C-methyl-D-erythritol 4-phosphate cytidylyltransferase